MPSSPTVSSVPPRRLWSLVTGADFGRSNRWAQAQPLSALDAAVIAEIGRIKAEIAATMGVPPKFLSGWDTSSHPAPRRLLP